MRPRTGTARFEISFRVNGVSYDVTGRGDCQEIDPDRARLEGEDSWEDYDSWFSRLGLTTNDQERIDEHARQAVAETLRDQWEADYWREMDIRSDK